MYVFKKYKEFLIKKRNELFLENKDKCTKIDGVYLYFSKVLANKIVMPDTATRIKPTMQH